MNSMARKISRGMVAPSRLLEKVGDSFPKSVSWDVVGNFGLASYEAGMIEVLRGIAEEDMEYGVGCIVLTPRMEKSLKVTVEKSEELRQNLDEDELRLFNEFEDAFNDSSMSEAEENYIQGFVRGYRYLRNQMEYRGGSI